MPLNIMKHILALASCLTCFTIPALALSAPAADSVRVIILSDRVGPVIDSLEAEEFRVLRQFAPFRSAMAVQLPDSSFAFIVTRYRPGDANEDTLIRCSFASLRAIGEKINHFGELVKGEYVMGTDVPVLRYADTGQNVRPPASQRPASPSRTSASGLRQPVASPGPGTPSIDWIGKPLDGYPREYSYPGFEISFGFRTFNPDTKGLASVFGQKADFSYDPLVNFGVELRLTEIIGIQAEGGGSVSGGANLGTVGPLVYFPFFGDNLLVPFAGAGYAVASMSNKVGDYHVSAGSQGFYLSLGVQIGHERPVAADLYGVYTKFKAVSTVFQDSPTDYHVNPDNTVTYVYPPPVSASMNFTHFAAGIRFRIRL